MVRRALAVVAAGLVVTAVAGPAAAAAGHTTGRAAEPLGQVSAPQPRADEWWFANWAVQQKVWPLTEGTGVTVGILDTGVQAGVTDLRGTILPGGDTTGSGTNGTRDFDTSDHGHGTAVASLIAGQGRGTGMVGVAPHAKILPVVVNASSTGIGTTPVTVAAGIRLAVDHGAEIINISTGNSALNASTCDPGEQDAVSYALKHDVVVVAAAGDMDKLAGPFEPASCAGVLAVGAVEPDASLWPESTQQPYVAVAAPGADVGWSGIDSAYTPYGFGTSFSAALTSGVAALVRARNPSMPWYQVVQRVIATALPEGSGHPNDGFGYGIVRPDRAVDPSGWPVPASAPNPVYAAYRTWLASTGAGQAPGSAASRSATAGTSAGVGAAAVLILVIMILVGAGVVTLLVTRRRRTRPPQWSAGRQPSGYGPSGGYRPSGGHGPPGGYEGPGGGARWGPHG